jgi:hypothetical protein
LYYVFEAVTGLSTCGEDLLTDVGIIDLLDVESIAFEELEVKFEVMTYECFGIAE